MLVSPLCLCWCRANTSLFLVFNHEPCCRLTREQTCIAAWIIWFYVYMYADSHLEARIFVFMASSSLRKMGYPQRCDTKKDTHLCTSLLSTDGTTSNIKIFKTRFHVVDDDYWTMSSTMLLLLYFLRPISDFTCTQEDKLRGDKCSTSSRGSPLSNVLI